MKTLLRSVNLVPGEYYMPHLCPRLALNLWISIASWPHPDFRLETLGCPSIFTHTAPSKPPSIEASWCALEMLLWCTRVPHHIGVPYRKIMPIPGHPPTTTPKPPPTRADTPSQNTHRVGIRARSSCWNGITCRSNAPHRTFSALKCWAPHQALVKIILQVVRAKASKHPQVIRSIA